MFQFLEIQISIVKLGCFYFSEIPSFDFKDKILSHNLNDK